MNQAMVKSHLRQSMQAMRDALPQAMREEAARTLVQKMFSPPFCLHLPAKGGVIAGYMPIRSEIDPRPFMHKLYAEGFILALPCIKGDDLVFQAYQPEDALIKGAYAILEPKPDAPRVTPALILTPLLAYDAQGGRLGYGKGYYDRAFLRYPEARRVGLAFSCQHIPHVPRDAHDVLLHDTCAV